MTKKKTRGIKSEWLLLAVIFIVGAFFRLYRLDLNPPALNWDETSQGWNAYSLLLTGRDEWGMFLPTTFRAFGEYKLPLYTYATTLPVALLGLNAISVRLVSALAGSLAILGIYFLANNMFRRPLKFGRHTFSIGLLAALILSLTPWHFFISRPALEANLSLTLVIFGLAMLASRNLRQGHIFGGLTLLSLSLHTYNSARVFVPLVLLVWFLMNLRKLKINWGLISGLAVLAISLGLVLAQVLSGTGLARYKKLAILSENKVYEIGQNRLNSNLPQPLPRLVHNRPVYFTTTFLKNYLGYFSPRFIYQTEGQSQFAMPGVNLLGIPILVMAGLGFFVLLRKLKKENAVLLFSVLLLAPVPAALTADPPQALRPLYLIPALVILAALGARAYLGIFQAKPKMKMFATLLLVGVLVLGFGKYYYNYWQSYRAAYAFAWQDGYRQLFEYLGANEDKYDRVIVTKYLGEPHIYLAFYNKIPPNALQPGEDNIRFTQSDWWWTDRVGKYFFANDWELTKDTRDVVKLESDELVPLKGSLVAASPGNLPVGIEKLTEIRGLNGELVFEIGEGK